LTNEPNNVNCLNSRAIIEYLRRHYPEHLAELISGLPSSIGTMPRLEEYLCDENNWVPSSLVVKMFENAKRITGNPEVAFSIGFESITHRDLGYAQRLFLTLFASPQSLLRKNQRLHEKLNKTKKITVISEGPLRSVLRLDWFDGVRSSHDVCSYNRGIYSALPTLWGYAPALVEESPCRFEGGEYCKITINWGLGVGRIKGFLSRLLKHRKHPRGESAKLLEEARLLVEKDKEDLRQRSDELQNKVEILKAINAATQILVSSPDIQQVLDKTLRPMITVLGFDRALIMSYSEQTQSLDYLYGVGGVFDDMDRIKDYRIPITKDDNLVIKVFKQREPVIIKDATAAGLNLANRILHDFQPGAFVVCPMFAEDRIIGMLGVDRLDRTRPPTQNDAEYLSIFANNIAAAINLKKSYEGAISALVKAIEVNDTYTRGHSERVSKISVEMASFMGYEKSKIDVVRFGCILHDVGKIGHASYLELHKDGPLTQEEYQHIKEHPVRGEEILKANAFFNNEIQAIVRNHHERWDGKGYPDGLAGEAIPLEAQIVAVADAYDAMTSDRPYRKGIPPQRAADEITRCSGTQFSPRAAEAFMQIYTLKRINKINGNLEISKEKY
jgi:putative nucleotidyltransferase with HDIG domain